MPCERRVARGQAGWYKRDRMNRATGTDQRCQSSLVPGLRDIHTLWMGAHPSCFVHRSSFSRAHQNRKHLQHCTGRGAEGSNSPPRAPHRADAALTARVPPLSPKPPRRSITLCVERAATRARAERASSAGDKVTHTVRRVAALAQERACHGAAVGAWNSPGLDNPGSPHRVPHLRAQSNVTRAGCFHSQAHVRKGTDGSVLLDSIP